MAKATISLKARWLNNQVLVDAHNATSSTLTLVAHERYLQVEVLDQRGQFVRGDAKAAGMPAKTDFVDVPARNKTLNVFTLDVLAEDDELTIGRFRFTDFKAPATIRVTYKSDPMVPNLPSNKRQSFYRGPVESQRCILEG